MLLVRERGQDDSLVEVIGSRVVDHVNVGIGRHGLVTDMRARHAQFVGFRRADASLLAPMAITSTKPSRRTASM